MSRRNRYALRKDNGAWNPATMTLGSFSPRMCGLDGHQIEVPGTRSNTEDPGAGRAPYAMQKRERDSNPDPLLDRKDDDRRGGRDDQQEFAERLPVNCNDLADMDNYEATNSKTPPSAAWGT